MTLEQPLTRAEWDRRFTELYNRGIQVGDIIESEGGPTGCFRRGTGRRHIQPVIPHPNAPIGTPYRGVVVFQ